MKVILKLFLLTVFVLLSSCTGNIVESTPSIDEVPNSNIVLSKFSDIQSKVFNISCTLSGCHVTGVQVPDLSGNSYNLIVNKPGSQSLNYIQPGDPGQSYLYLKLIGGNNIAGTRMPQNAPQLQRSIIDSISTWISNGALNN